MFQDNVRSPQTDMADMAYMMNELADFLLMLVSRFGKDTQRQIHASLIERWFQDFDAPRSITAGFQVWLDDDGKTIQLRGNPQLTQFLQRLIAQKVRRYPRFGVDVE